MADFALVHGSWHGAWCWDALREPLAKRGHLVHTFDLPGFGDDPTPTDQVTLEAYAERVIAGVHAVGRPVVLVGHSMGGLAITEAAERLSDSLRALVYVAAFVPGQGQTLLELSRAGGETALTRAVVMGPDGASVLEDAIPEVFYHCCDEAQVERARARLSPVQPIAPLTTPVTTADATLERLARFYVECLQDRAIAPSFQTSMRTAAKIDRVHVLDTDHSPFLSCPEALADVLDAIYREVEDRP